MVLSEDRAARSPDHGSLARKLLACSRTGSVRGEAGRILMRIVVAALLLALSFAAVPGGTAFAKDPPPVPQSVELLKKPMFFYVAKGGPNACGPGCNEWIAAEGTFDLGVAGRLRAFLSKQRNRNLPIYFYSP